MTASNQEQALIELYQISRQLVSPNEINSRDILQRIAESAAKAVNADIVTLYTYNQSQQKFEQRFFVGELLQPEFTTVPENVSRTLKSSSRFVMREKIQSSAVIALKFGDESLGILFVNYRTPQTFTQEQRELIELFANQAAIAIKTLRLTQQAYDAALSAKPPVVPKLQFYSCFISHSSRDEDFARKVYTDLQANAVHCWFAPVDMKIGDRIRSRIDETIREYEKLLLILSKSSIASQWVEHEVEAALAKEREKKNTVLFPIRLDDRIMKSRSGWANYIRNTRNIGDFSKWQDPESYNKSLRNLLDDLAKQKIPN